MKRMFCASDYFGIDDILRLALFVTRNISFSGYFQRFLLIRPGNLRSPISMFIIQVSRSLDQLIVMIAQQIITAVYCAICNITSMKQVQFVDLFPAIEMLSDCFIFIGGGALG